MNKTLMYIAITALAAGVLMPILSASSAPTQSPVLDNAIHTLEATKADLTKLQGDFGGHKAYALKNIDATLKSLRASRDYAVAHPEKMKPDAKKK